VAAHAVTTIHHLYRKADGQTVASNSIAGLLQDHAVRLAFSDFENAVTAAAADRTESNYIFPRNAKDFRGSPVRCLTPEALLQILSTR
jgi:hypothetical protein